MNIQINPIIPIEQEMTLERPSPPQKYIRRGKAEVFKGLLDEKMDALKVKSSDTSKCP